MSRFNVKFFWKYEARDEKLFSKSMRACVNNGVIDIFYNP